MSIEELIHKAHEQGANAGQIALGEYILNRYGNDLPKKLEEFLGFLVQTCYEDVAKAQDKPSEDVALEVHEIMKKRLG